MALAAGTRVGPYEVLGLIGAGGMGEVYLAQDVRLSRQVALKRLVARSSDESPTPDRLLNEARTIATLNHPNIAAVYDVFESDDSAFIVMEYAPGETLASVLRGGPLPADRVIDIGLQLCSALVAAHEAGVLHQDLKPSNIHLSSTGRIKVLDFGIALIANARPHENTDADTRTSSINPLAGTPGYIAPEQLAGQRPDQRSDIYAAGVVLFQLATGKQPFEGADPLGRLLSTIRGHQPQASDVHPGVPQRLSDVIGCALAALPAERYQSAAAFKSALEAVADALQEGSGDAVAAGTTVEGGLTRKWGRRLVLGALVVMAITAISMLARRSGPAPPDASVAPGRATVAVLRPENRTGQRQTNEWPSLIQSLLASELTGVPDLAVMDVLALNDLLDASPSQSLRQAAALEVLRRAKVTLILVGEVVADDRGYRINARVVNAVNGESQFSTHADVAEESALPSAARTVATKVLSFLQVNVLQVQDKDLRPWISYRDQNIDAVKAFVIGNQYIYRRQPAESEKYIRRAIDLDPSFIAPKLWLVPRLIKQGKMQEAQDTLHVLHTLESTASPFEQSLIDYVSARLQRDVPKQVRALEMALTYSPGNNILLVNLADLQLASGDCTRALTTMQSAVEIGWRYPPLYPLWAWCSAEVGHRDQAARGIDRALELVGVSDEPDIYGLLEAVAIAIEDTSRAATCRKLYEKRRAETGATGISRELAFVYRRLGDASLRYRSFKAAVTLYERAVAADPSASTNHDSLGTALEATGDLERAKKSYITAITMDPAINHARERLRALGDERRPKGDR